MKPKLSGPQQRKHCATKQKPGRFFLRGKGDHPALGYLVGPMMSFNHSFRQKWRTGLLIWWFGRGHHSYSGKSH
jgi:hypothetical protein